MLRWNPSRCSLYPFTLAFSVWLLWRESLHPLCSYSLRTGILLWGSSWTFFSPGKKGLIPSVFHQKTCFITLWSFLWPFFGLSLVCLHLSWIVGMRTGYGTADVAWEMLSGVGWSHPCLWMPLRIKPRIQSFTAMKHCWLMVSLLSTKTPRSLWTQQLPSHINPLLFGQDLVILPQVQDLEFSVKCHAVLATPLFQSVQLSVGWISLVMCHEQTWRGHFQSHHPHDLWRCWKVFIPEGWLVTGCQPE